MAKRGKKAHPCGSAAQVGVGGQMNILSLCGLVVDAMSIVTGCLEGSHTGEPAVQQRMGFYARGHTKELSGMIFLKPSHMAQISFARHEVENRG